jgi:Uma2 family endonuclease
VAATVAFVPVEQYLHTSYEPDCDYVDGELEERALGEYDHATWQTILAAFFTVRQKEWGIKARTELRVKVSPQRYRVLDVVLLSRSAPVEQIVEFPPLAVFEILSPEDRMTRVLAKLEDYAQMGIGAIWVIEPKSQKTFRYTSGNLAEA